MLKNRDNPVENLRRTRAIQAFACPALVLFMAVNGSPQSSVSQSEPAQALGQIIQKPSAEPAKNLEEVVDRAINSERILVDRLRSKEPVIETYIQEVKKDTELGFVPQHDYYYLGKLNVSDGIVDDSFLSRGSGLKKIPHMFASVFTTEYYPRGFADEMFIDQKSFDRAHYKFEFVKREFLGTVRCFVLNVVPKENAGKGRFQGRVWIEDRDYNIVRYNGRYVPSQDKEFTHFDSWRVNAGGLWLPAYIYAQEEGFRWGPVHAAPIRGQTRLWDYETSRDQAQQAFTELTVESPEGVRDESTTNTNGYSPVQATRMWEAEAEENLIDRLRKAGLVAPANEVDQVLDTVVNNLEVTNNISFETPVHARILLTTPLESVAVNHTILISRGLVDVLPDEACLAAVLAHELAHVVLGHSVNTKYAFADRLLFDDPAVLKKVSIARTQKEEQAADDKAIEMLKHSPYADKLPKVGLFLSMLSARSDNVPHLIRPLLGNRVSDTKKDLRMSGLMDLAPELEVRDKNQISALPLGSRVTVNPWSDELRLLKAQTVSPSSAKEKMPFQVTPFMVYLTREGDEHGAIGPSKGGATEGTAAAPPPGSH